MGDYTTDRVLGAAKTYNAVFTDKKDNSTLTQDDFMKLMITELTNQDFNKAADTSKMVDQMVQFSNMQAMNKMLSYSQTNYAMSFVGKTVTASRYTVSGEVDTVTGTVDKVSLVDDEYLVYIGSKKFSLSQITAILNSDEASATIDPTRFSLNSSEATSNSVKISWEVPTEDESEANTLKYSVYYSKDPAFTTVDEILKNGTLGGSSIDSDYFEQVVSRLEAGTEYYFNVIVEDGNGNKYCYKPITAKTITE